MDLPVPLARLLMEVARRTRGANTLMVAMFFGNPYVATFVPDVPTMLLTYDYYDLAERSAFRALTGAAPISGRLPVTLSDQFPVGHGLSR